MKHNELKGKRLLLLGGSTWKDAIKKFAEENEVVLIAAGLWRVGIYDIADECYTVDILNANLMKDFIVDKHIDGVYMGGAENVISVACQYVTELGLPCYCNKQQWESLQDKANFKKLCLQYDLPVVPQYLIDSNNIRESVPVDEYPVITKPTDGCGSSGFSVCYNAEELVAGYERAALDSPSQSVICEKFVKNDGVVAFYTFSDGKAYFSGLEDKYPVRYEKQGSYVGGLFVFESDIVDEFRNLFDKKVERLIQSLGIKEGSAWIEVFHDGDSYYFNEVGFRYGGSVSIYPVEYFHGYNQVAADMYYSLTGKSCIENHLPLLPESLPRKKRYCIFPVHIYAGTIKSIVGFDKIMQMQDVALVSVTKKVGDTIADTGSFSQALALIHFVCDDSNECKEIINQIYNTLDVRSTEGDNMIHPMLNFEKVFF